MPETRITLQVWRQPGNGRLRAGYQSFEIATDPDRDTVLDLIERVWADLDRTLVFRHACHHASCGTCAVLVDGRERLPCVTFVRSGPSLSGECPFQTLRTKVTQGSRSRPSTRTAHVPHDA